MTANHSLVHRSVVAVMLLTVLILTGVFATGCASTTASRQVARHYFVPPLPVMIPETMAAIDPPDVVPALTVGLYVNESPQFGIRLPVITRPSDADFLIRASDERFAAGKRALQDGRTTDARREFDKAIEILLTTSDNMADRARVERHLEELIEQIYRYDIDELGAAQKGAGEEANYEKSPLEGIIDMTFPIDPESRSKVRDEIARTASQLPLEVPDPVVSFINYFSSPQGKKVLTFGLRHSGRYKPMIERILRDEGVPQELIFLAQAESGFFPRARSNAECVGLWQFQGARGREYGLNQTPATDDRMDPERATRAAAKHLHDLYSHFGDWYLAMAAYNCGPGCVDSAILRTGYADFWTLRRLGVLPGETANYVPIILAMTVMAKNPKDYGLDDVELEEPVAYDTVELESPTHLALLAEAMDRPVSELRELNPSLLRLVAPLGFALHVPKGTLPQVEAALQAVPASRRDAWRLHRVNADDTFAVVAKRYGVMPNALSAANREALPEVGAWAVVPVAYPGDPVPVARTRAIRYPVRAALRKPIPMPMMAPRTAAAPGTTPKTTLAKASPIPAVAVRHTTR
jgi:membrane-bound lytic murein transglycosylase D